MSIKFVSIIWWESYGEEYLVIWKGFHSFMKTVFALLWKVCLVWVSGKKDYWAWKKEIQSPHIMSREEPLSCNPAWCHICCGYLFLDIGKSKKDKMRGIKKILKHLGLWEVKPRPPPKATGPQKTHEYIMDYFMSELPAPAHRLSGAGPISGYMLSPSILRLPCLIFEE